MWELIKSMIVGVILAFVVSLFIGSGGSTGGVLNVRHFVIEGVGFYWSWVLFVAGTALTFGLLLMMK